MGKKKSEEKDREFKSQMSRWPVYRTSLEDMTGQEKIALKKTEMVWELAIEYLSSERHDMWKIDKDSGDVQFSSAKCNTLNQKLFKATYELDWNWRKILDILNNVEDSANWNETLESCKQVAILPPPDSLKDGSAAFINYMRMSTKVSKLITQRDFVSCCLLEVSDESAILVGTYCEIDICPPAAKLIRAEQNIIVFQIQQLTEDKSKATQIMSISFNGLIWQAIMDSQMARAQRKYAESLRAKIELEKSLECSNSKRMGTEKSHVTSVYSANSNDHTKTKTGSRKDAHETSGEISLSSKSSQREQIKNEDRKSVRKRRHKK